MSRKKEEWNEMNWIEISRNLPIKIIFIFLFFFIIRELLINYSQKKKALFDFYSLTEPNENVGGSPGGL